MTDAPCTQPAALLVVTPHASGALPADILHDMLGDAAQHTATRDRHLRRVFLDGDPYTDLIYHVPGARHVQAPWSRFAVDLNRTRDDQEDNGVIKLTTFDRQPLYPPGFVLTPEAREQRLRRHWDPFDALITSELQGAALMIVGHCMAATGPALGPDQGAPRPAVCLMTGTDHAPTFPRQHWAALRDACAQHFTPVLPEHAPRDVTIGVPWQTDTLSATHHARSAVPAFGIEVNAGLYLRGTGPDTHPDDHMISDLNRAFRDFAHAALTLLT
ncbi:N-formylglutamate amidohydrolase [Deinococcus taeanensis]|uniref:N-formylglutamate amidohydrolase n=1 Tax=Deinococcus taeanensis TaxID=2737050 RepID=UPI001CDB5180|nr:N-formylglutamate amidohydrolase [Deinococcus taeanensis]UBV41527.1 N-formylglutamate amidohydrolase [Deinococcus taeanensis]